MKLLTIVLALALAAPSLGALAAPSLAFGCGVQVRQDDLYIEDLAHRYHPHQLLPPPSTGSAVARRLPLCLAWRWLVRMQVSVPDGGPAFVRKAGR